MSASEAVMRVLRAFGAGPDPEDDERRTRIPPLPAACGGAILGAALTALSLGSGGPGPELAIAAAPPASAPRAVVSTAAPVRPAPPPPETDPHDPCQAELDAAMETEEEDEGGLALEEALLRDPGLLPAAVERFRRVTDPGQLAILAVTLARFRDPEVESLALELCARAPEADRRAAAFEILDGLELPSALPAVLEALERERDPIVRRAALFALPPMAGASSGDAAQVVERLGHVLAGDPDAESRRRAALGLGDWSRAPGAVAALVEGLRGDRSVDVRAGCAFALEQARPSDLASRGALLAALEDPREDPLVRENAWRALGASAPLEPREHAAWAAFREQRAGAEDPLDGFPAGEEQGE